MTTTSRVPALITYLAAEFTAAAALGAATPPVAVYDGPATTADPSPLALYVGVGDAFATTAATSAESQQTSAGLGLGKKDETITIHCAAVAWAGTDDMATVRASAYAIAAAVEDLVRNDTTTFGGLGALARPGVTAMTLTQNSTAAGAVAQVAFQIQFKTMIGA